MNFDELQKQWNDQSSDEVQINSDLEIKQEANTVIDKVRKVMKKDFFFQLTSFPLILIYPIYFQVDSPIVWWMACCICATMSVPLFYLVKFYNASYKLEYNSLRNINWFYYNFKSSILVFKIFTYVICCLCIMFLGVLLFEKIGLENIRFDTEFYLSCVAFLVVCVIFCIWMTKCWIGRLYIKPLKELEEILNQLEE